MIKNEISGLHKIFKFECLKEEGYPFNIKFKPNVDFKKNKDFHGCGIYFIRYDEDIIYIGTYAPNSSVYERWVKHIQSFTLRGSEVNFMKINGNHDNQQQNDKKVNFLNIVNKLNEELAADLGNSSLLMQKLRGGSCVVGKNRIEFAADNWNEFKKWTPDPTEDGVSEKFKFVFFKLQDELGHLETVERKKHLEYIEAKLIKKFNPRCNGEYISEEGANNCSKLFDQIIKNKTVPQDL